MSREWKAGDVAVVWINDRRELALVRPRQEAGIRGGLEFAYVNGGFDMVDDLAPGWAARPLVVIDPEDREQCDELAALLWPHYVRNERARLCKAEIVEAALRSLVTPPKPDEPTGLGAVVEDAEAHKWVLTPSQNGHVTLSRWNDGIAWKPWADIAAVKVLSEGVTR